jgi:ABC-2 type transport system permease protein
VRPALAYEWIRATTTRGPFLLMAAGIVVGILTAWALGSMISSLFSLDSPGLRTEAVSLAATRSPAILVCCGLIGVFAFSQETRHGTLLQAGLGIPRRGVLFAAKVVVTLSTCIVFAVLCTGSALVTALSSVRGATLADVDPAVLLRCVLLAAGWSLLGVGLGAVLPRMAAVLVLLVGSAIVEPLLGQLLSVVHVGGLGPLSGFLPFSAGSSLLALPASELGAAVGETGSRLSPLLGGCVFAVYVGVVLVVGWRSIRHRVI